MDLTIHSRPLNPCIRNCSARRNVDNDALRKLLKPSGAPPQANWDIDQLLKALPPPVQPSSWGLNNSKANRLPVISRPIAEKPIWKRVGASDFMGGPSNLDEDSRIQGRSKDDLDKPSRVVLPPIERPRSLQLTSWRW